MQPNKNDRVYDEGMPSVLGTVITPGAQTSEVKWDQESPWGKTSYVNNDRLFFSIPKVLLVKNRKPLTKEQEAKLAEARKNDAPLPQQTTKQLPASALKDPVALQILEQERNKRRVAAPPPSATAEPKPAKPAKQAREASQRSKPGMLTAHDFAKRIGCPAKLVRRALRTTKAIAKPAGGWVFTEAEAPKVIDVVTAWLYKVGKAPAKASAPAAPVAAKPAPIAAKPAKAPAKPAKAPAAKPALTKIAKKATPAKPAKAGKDKGR